jgi:hypothetical protein
MSPASAPNCQRANGKRASAQARFLAGIGRFWPLLAAIGTGLSRQDGEMKAAGLLRRAAAAE